MTKAGPKNLAVHTGHRQRIRSRFETHGLDSFADHEALELLLFYAIPRRDTNKLAHKLLNACDGSLSSVFDKKPEQLSLLGAAQHSAGLIYLMNQFERIYRRDKTSCGQGMKHLSSAQQAKRYADWLFAFGGREQVWLCSLDARMTIRNCLPLSSQFKSDLLRKIVAAADLTGSSHLILFLSHPDGQPAFFSEELQAAKVLSEALNQLGIRLFDIVLHTADGCVSYMETGFRL